MRNFHSGQLLYGLISNNIGHLRNSLGQKKQVVLFLYYSVLLNGTVL